MNHAQFKGQLMTLAELTNKDLSSLTVKYFWDTFGTLPDDVIQPAFELAKRTCKFFPSPAEFGELVESLTARSGEIVNGATAWESCQQLIFGRYSEATEAQIRKEGNGYPWPNERCKHVTRKVLGLTVRDIAMKSGRDLDITRAKFIAAYDSVQAVERAEAAIEGPKLRALPEAG